MNIRGADANLITYKVAREEDCLTVPSGLVI